jgi:predicted secreted protein
MIRMTTKVWRTAPARPWRRLGAALLAAAATAAANAQTVATGAPPPPANVVALSASATVELTMDWLTVVFSTTREGPDAAAVQGQVRQALETALAEARRVARPGEVLVRTGAFALQPRYGQKGGVTGWQGHAELVIEGRDTAAIAQAMGRIQTLTVGRVSWSLSREMREKVEGEVTAQAIARFRSRAEEVARLFGMAGYTLREVAVSGNEPGAMPPVLMRAQAARVAADESLPVEAGKAQVTATVSGTVQLR